MENDKSIVITGTSTGIGKACALYLDNLGYNVYAGVRNPVDGDKLKKESSDRLTTLIIDVSNVDSIQAATAFVEKETDGNVFGLINNAGIGRGGALEVTSVAEIRALSYHDISKMCVSPQKHWNKVVNWLRRSCVVT